MRRRLLDPVSRISEILFGVIMALTITTTLSAATAGRSELRTLLAGALGCNLAWGLVDAVMYLMALLAERGADRVRARQAHAKDVPHPGLTRDDWFGALGIFLLVFLSTFPIVIPFLVVRDVLRAVRLSNLVAIVMLFACGYSIAKHGGYSPWRAGLSMVLLGVVLVAIAIALGG
jgi:hypothetical protein